MFFNGFVYAELSLNSQTVIHFHLIFFPHRCVNRVSQILKYWYANSIQIHKFYFVFVDFEFSLRIGMKHRME